MYKVKFHQNFESDVQIYNRILSMSPNNSGVWKNVKMTIGDDYDIFVILNHPQHSHYDKSRTIVFESETPSTRRTFPKFYKGMESEFLYVHDTETHFNVDMWYHGLSYDELSNPLAFEKTKSFSIINSNLNNLPGHMLRNSFIDSITNKIEFDLFGRFYNNNKNYRGSLSKKSDGLVGYHYTFNQENDFENNYFTEKILDGIMCECLTFYGGCPNIRNFINPNSFIEIDITNKEESFYIIRDSIKSNIWKSFISNIREEKRRIMVDHNILNIVNNILERV